GVSHQRSAINSLSLSLSHRAEACAWRSADLGTVITLGDLAQAASFSKHTPQLVDTLQIRNVVGIAGDSEGDLARRSAAPIPNRDSLVVAKHQRVRTLHDFPCED